MIYPYGKKDTIFVVGGLVFYHVLVIALCIFWIYKFLVLIFDPGVFVLLAIFCIGTAVCDYLLHKVNGFDRFLVCYECSRDGILYRKPGKRKTQIAWAEIQAFGICGFAEKNQSPEVYFSKDRIGYAPKREVPPSENMVRFRLDQSVWKKTCGAIPADMAEKLENAIAAQRDCHFRR